MSALLIAILVLSAVTLVWMGFRQWRRRRLLGRLAHACGLRFSPADPFGLVRQYASCYLMQSGHSAHAANVLFGRLGDWNLRMFDYRFEVGHGPHRVARRYSVVAVDTPGTLASALVWRDGPSGSMGLPLAEAARAADQWWQAGDAAVAECVRNHWPQTGFQSIGIETIDATVLFATEDRLDADGLRRYLQAVTGCLERLSSAPSAG